MPGTIPDLAGYIKSLWLFSDIGITTVNDFTLYTKQPFEEKLKCCVAGAVKGIDRYISTNMPNQAAMQATSLSHALSSLYKSKSNGVVFLGQPASLGGIEPCRLKWV